MGWDLRLKAKGLLTAHFRICWVFFCPLWHQPITAEVVLPECGYNVHHKKHFNSEGQNVEKRIHCFVLKELICILSSFFIFYHFFVSQIVWHFSASCKLNVWIRGSAPPPPHHHHQTCSSISFRNSRLVWATSTMAQPKPLFKQPIILRSGSDQRKEPEADGAGATSFYYPFVKWALSFDRGS